MFLLDDRFVFPTADNSISFDDQKLLTARRIAQWAINVVDYRDADLVMTGFEYDTNPYNGWDVDQDLSTPETTERDVVWGCETPVLLLTESLAFHDRRVKDTDSELGGALRDANDNSDTSPDDTDLDQTRIPQGSLFLELYCPSNNSQLFNKSADLFDAAGLNLAKMSPPPPSGGPGAVGVPVWRIAISRPIADIMNQPGPGYVDPSDRRTVLAQMDRASFQPSEPYMLVPPGRYDEIERLVWFTTVRPAIVAYPASLPTGYPLSQTIANTFYNRGGATHIMDGEFKLVIPRRTTYIGEKNVGGTAELSDQKIVYDSTSQSVRFDDLELATIEPAIRGLPIIAKADEPTISSWSTLLVNNPTTYEPGIGLNVSEPLIGPDYYPAPTADFGSGTAMVYDRYATPKDNPFDSTPAGTGQARKLIDYGNAALWTGVHDIGPAVALRRTAYLQRLADPNSAFDPVTNPYLTVDWIPIDLTVFNGSSGQKELALPQVPVGQYLDPDDIGNAPAYVNEVGGPDIMFQPPTYFASRLRGTPATPPAAAPNDIWSASWSTPDFLADMSDQLTDRDTVADEIVNYNVRFDVDLGGIGPSASFTPVASSGQPLPWINSANRPFVSELDLMLVPSSSPDRLAFEYSMATAVGMPSPYDSYAQTLPAFVYRAAPFGHLLNFFQRTPNTTGAPPIAANLSRVFDFLDVPSRFVGTQHHFLSPTTVAGTPQQIGFDGFWAPFNRLSKMREPGKINLNTIYDQNVWNALVSGYPDHVDPVETGSQTLGKFDEFVRSRQGYELPSTIALSAPNITNSYAFDYEFPSVFSKPFAASSTSGLLPDKLTGVAVPPSFGSDSTLLRQSPTSPVPFFGPMSGTFGTHNNPERNPGFAYAGIQRLANMTTTQSNVYAVWITMGYFEVTPWPGGIDAAHPDGLQLGRELGEATGDIERHRAFYLIDRSVPVAFEPGQNHNVDDAVIIRRFIE